MAFAGPRNRQGEIGPQGPEGKRGKPGKDGVDGIHGRNGKNGKDGKDGKDGITRVVRSGSFSVADDPVYSFRPKTQFSCGLLKNFDQEDFDLIECCALPVTGVLNVKFDLGELSGMCN